MAPSCPSPVSTLTAASAKSWRLALETRPSPAEAPQPTMRLSELAAIAEGWLPQLSQVVSRLEKRGGVRRTPDPTDGRYTVGILTDDGWDKVVATAPAMSKPCAATSSTR